jgi:hypothetical protein
VSFYYLSVLNCSFFLSIILDIISKVWYSKYSDGGRGRNRKRGNEMITREQILDNMINMGVDCRLVLECRLRATKIPDDEEADGKHDGLEAMLRDICPACVRELQAERGAECGQ